MKRVKQIFLTVLFLVIGFVGINIVCKPFSISNSYSEHAEMMINGYYNLEEDSVDVVVVGNSHVYRYWQCAFAFNECGLASASWSTSDLPYSTIKNVAIETLKTQSPKVLVLDATVFANGNAEANNKIYLLLDNMKYSTNYFDMINNFCYYSGITGADKLQYYFPVVQFHSRWTDLNKQDFVQTQESYLNSCYQEDFLKKVSKKSHVTTTEAAVVDPKVEEALIELLEWVKEQEDVEVIFYASPLLNANMRVSHINYIQDIVESYGIEFLNFNEDEKFESFGFDVTQDFQDSNHTNVNGSYKFTKTFAQYLMDTYDLEDKRGNDDYSSWQEQAGKYYDIVEEYLKKI